MAKAPQVPFKNFNFGQKVEIFSLLALGLVGVVLGIVAIAAPIAGSSSVRGEYSLAGGAIGAVLGIVTMAYAAWLLFWYGRGKKVKWLTRLIVALALVGLVAVFALSAVAVSYGS